MKHISSVNIFQYLFLYSIFLLVGCDDSSKVKHHLERADYYLSQNQSNSAIIELKNAVQLDPGNAETRYVLGKTHMQVGDVNSAIKELNRAVNLNYDKNKSLPLLLQALSIADEHTEVLLLASDHNLTEPAAKSALLYYKLKAFLSNSDESEIFSVIDQIKTMPVDLKYVRLTEVYSLLLDKQTTAAKQQLDSLLDSSPNFIEAQLLKAQILIAFGDLSEAQDILADYLITFPSDLKTTLLLANLYTETQNFNKAEALADKLLSVAPEHAFSNFIKAESRFYNKDFESSKLFGEKAFQNGLITTQVRLIVGLSNFQLQQYEQAKYYLEAINDDLPDEHPARRVLAMTQLALGETVEVKESLMKLGGYGDEDSSFLIQTSYYLWQQGDSDSAKELLKLTDSLGVNKALSLLQQGVLKRAIDKKDGLKEIEKALAIDPALPAGKLALAFAYIDEGLLEKAQLIANEMKKSAESEVQGLNISATVFKQQNKLAMAATEYRKALALDKNNLASLMFLADQALEEKDYGNALPWLERLINRDPVYIPALFSYQTVSKLANKEDKALEQLAHLYQKTNKFPMVSLVYGKALFDKLKYSESIKVLEQIRDESTLVSQRYRELLALSYQNTTQPKQVIATYKEWVSLAPRDFSARLALTKALEKQNRLGQALQEAEAAKRIFPNNLKATSLVIKFQLLTGKLDEAKALIANLTHEEQSLPLIQGFKGQILAANGHYDNALKLLTEHYETAPSVRSAGRLFVIYLNAKKSEEAKHFMSNHLLRFPKDISNRMLFAEYLLTQNTSLAMKQYEVIVSIQEDNLLAINNLAWLLYKNNELKRAETFAEKAVLLDSSNAQILDTAGVIKTALNKKNEALELLQKAKNIEPDDVQIAKHYSDAQKL